MTLPQGAIWQALRARALDTVPSGTHINLSQPATLSAWQASGAYTVASASTKNLSLIASSVDVGATLLSDAQFHLDHAAEHQAALLHDLRSGQWNSPAWLLVTFYYWSYFVAMSLTRILGDTVWFVNDSVAAQLSKLASSTTGKLGAGTFQFTCDAAVSASDRTLTMKKRSRRVHEQLWFTTFALLDDLYKSAPSVGLDPREQRLYLAILASASGGFSVRRGPATFETLSTIGLGLPMTL